MNELKNVIIKKANLNDAEEIYDLINNVSRDMNEKSLLSVSKNIDTYLKSLRYEHSVIACDDLKIVGCFLCYKTDIDEHGLYKLLNYNDDEKKQTVVMQVCVVLSEYRGQNLQHRMLLEVEKMLRESNIKKCIGTIHPNNKYSLNNMLKNGYKVKIKAKLYGGLDRYIIEKEL